VVASDKASGRLMKVLDTVFLDMTKLTLDR